MSLKIVRKPYCYCSLCFHRLSREKGGFCPVCEQKTTAVGLFDKVERDSSFSSKEKTELRFCALIMIAVIVMEIIVCLVTIAIAGSYTAQPEYRAESESASALSASSENSYPEELGTPPSYEDYEFYMDSDNAEGLNELWLESGLTREQQEYWRSIYEQRYIYSDGKAGEQRELNENRLRTQAEEMQVLADIAVSVLRIAIVMQAAGLILCVLVALKKEWALGAMLNYGQFCAALAAIHVNLVCAAAVVYVTVQVGKIIKKAEYGAVYDREGKIRQAKRLMLNKDEWKCPKCGYINTDSALECISCGKYK